MRKKITLLIFTLFLNAAGIFAQQAADKPQYAGDAPKVVMVQGHILSIDDSDRVTFVGKDGTVYATSLLAVDSPDQNQNYYKKAKKRLSDLLDGKDVTAIVRKNDNGRYLASVYVAGQDVSLRLLQDGFAWYFPGHWKELNASEREKYSMAESASKTAKLGLWEDKEPVAPWVFRGEKIETEPAKVEAVQAEASSSGPESDPDKETPKAGRTYILGPRGGCYYLNDKGYKTYVKDKSLCVKQ